MKHLNAKQDGFTILELLIATTIFTVVLLLLTLALIQIGRQYYKGITSSKTQSVARSISDEVAQAIQFSGGAIVFNDVGASKYLCTDNSRFIFQNNVRLTGGATNHVFVLRSPTGGTCPGSVDYTSGLTGPQEKELMGLNMRVLNFKVETVSGGTYKVTIKIATGDNDLLIDASSVRGDQAGFNPVTAKCAQTVGSQFCAVSELVTNVQRRV